MSPCLGGPRALGWAAARFTAGTQRAAGAGGRNHQRTTWNPIIFYGRKDRKPHISDDSRTLFLMYHYITDIIGYDMNRITIGLLRYDLIVAMILLLF